MFVDQRNGATLALERVESRIYRSLLAHDDNFLVFPDLDERIL